MLIIIVADSKQYKTQCKIVLEASELASGEAHSSAHLLLRFWLKYNSMTPTSRLRIRRASPYTDAPHQLSIPTGVARAVVRINM